ncbi:hypothetical protein N7537_010458 [Penicillium hordei]|uniref:Uncharacterized protein n=1 Tax=Penicillium hordei TaxID=40994 RepID=A0AAD6DUN9_9EURO|nr:uncharacterized protein N7537_010458 [Penicillium hordei]KAJ5593554.1 hypothetical protein N7537_010458 [Penicillium hordei]
MAKARALGGPLNLEANPTPTNDYNDDRGTKANPINIKDDNEVEGSETNPIVINDDADALGKQEIPVQRSFTGDTEPLGTPEFWAMLGNSRDQGFYVPSSQSVYSQISDCTCSPEPESIPKDELEEKGTEVAKSDNDKESTTMAAAPPIKYESRCRVAETSTISCDQHNFTWSSQGDELKLSTEASQTDNGHPSHSQRSGKRQRAPEGAKHSWNRRSKRLANKERK